MVKDFVIEISLWPNINQILFLHIREGVGFLNGGRRNIGFCAYVIC